MTKEQLLAQNKELEMYNADLRKKLEIMGTEVDEYRKRCEHLL